ncbi:MAG: hypothetical protein M3Z92_16690 [Bacteroidota bacterium]|nr:hypothetical protein [Bacteroidota bacterium]MDQ6890706.1 hypothetical protein [Bacteroidota bacterium]MDQ6903949.1 hypothetical protein [Bacteroidota bacterium]
MKNIEFQHRGNAFHKMVKVLLVLTFVLFLTACKSYNSTSVINEKFEGDGDKLERITQVIVPPPMLPKFDQADKDDAKIVGLLSRFRKRK